VIRRPRYKIKNKRTTDSEREREYRRGEESAWRRRVNNAHHRDDRGGLQESEREQESKTERKDAQCHLMHHKNRNTANRCARKPQTHTRTTYMQRQQTVDILWVLLKQEYFVGWKKQVQQAKPKAKKREEKNRVPSKLGI
jgi:hypothetical protein